MTRHNETERVYDYDAGHNAKRSVRHYHAWVEEPDALVPKRVANNTSLLIGISQTGVRIRFPRGTRSRVEYMPNPSQEFQSLTALWVCSLVPTGVFADKLEDDFPQYKEVADFLRMTEQKQQEIKP